MYKDIDQSLRWSNIALNLRKILVSAYFLCHQRSLPGSLCANLENQLKVDANLIL